jgi:AraC-like DNA-binding protein
MLNGPGEETRLPVAALRPWIAEIRVQSAPPLQPVVTARLPEAATSLVLCARGGGEFEIAAVGPRLRAHYKSSAAIPRYMRFTFRPGGARLFLGVAMHELGERALGLAELWGRDGGRRLQSELARARGSIAETIAAVESLLLSRVGRAEAGLKRRSLVQAATRAFEATGAEPPRIRAVARQLGVGERTLRQLFVDEIGISPKRYVRIARIRRVVARAGRVDWARLAAECGFYDQAHLNGEFRELLGVTPRAFLAGELPSAVPCS